MAVLHDLLQRLAHTLRITQVDPPIAQIGQFMRFSLGPDPGLLRAVDPDLVTKDLALALSGALTGNIVSPAVATTGTITEIGGTVLNNIQATTQSATSDVTVRLQDAAGALPSMTGALPIPIEVPLTVTVKWGAYRYVWRRAATDAESTRGPGRLDPDIRRVPPGEARERLSAMLVADSPPGSLIEVGILKERQELEIDQDFLAPGGVDLLEVAFLFAPPFVELTVRLPALQEIYVYAEVTLSVPNQPSVQRTIEVMVLMPPVAIPKLLALFRYPDFNMHTDNGVPRKGQAALLVVPADSPLGSYADLVPVLKTLGTVLAPLRKIARLSKFLLGLNLLGAALSRRPRLRMAVADRIDDLHAIKLIKYRAWQDPWVNDAIPDFNGWPGDDEDNDLYAGGVMSSLILLGPPESAVECFLLSYCNDVPPLVEAMGDPDAYKPNGRLEITTGPEGIALIRSLAYSADAQAPTTNPAGRAQVDPPPSPHTTGFDNRISSVRFS